MSEKNESVQSTQDETISKETYDELYKSYLKLNFEYSNAIALINNLINFIVRGDK